MHVKKFPCIKLDVIIIRPFFFLYTSNNSFNYMGIFFSKSMFILSIIFYHQQSIYYFFNYFLITYFILLWGNDKIKENGYNNKWRENLIIIKNC